MTLEVTSAEGVTVARLDRPDVLNAFNDELGNALVEAVRDAGNNDAVRCIVITGNGRAFSSGEDLAALSGAYESGQRPELGQTLINRYNPLIRAIREAPKPVVAAVNGVAAGAGASVALACDHRIATEKAKLVLAFVKVGLVPDSGVLWFLTRMIGTARTYQLAAEGRPLGAQEAFDLGIVDRVVPDEQFEAEWQTFASELASGPTTAFALIKQLVMHAAESPLEKQLQEEVHAQTRAGKTDDHMEGVTAFLGKRTPRFTGR